MGALVPQGSKLLQPAARDPSQLPYQQASQYQQQMASTARAAPPKMQRRSTIPSLQPSKDLPPQTPSLAHPQPFLTPTTPFHFPPQQSNQQQTQPRPLPPTHHHSFLEPSSTPAQNVFDFSVPFSPSFTPNLDLASPLPPGQSANVFGFSNEVAQTPGAGSNFDSSTDGGVGGEKDPFLSLLEQLAENEHSRGGPSELDYFLGITGNNGEGPSG